MARCKGRNLNGTKCKLNACEGSEFCSRHSNSSAPVMDTISEIDGNESHSISLPISVPVSVAESLAMEKLAEMTQKINMLEQMIKTLIIALPSDRSVTVVAAETKPRRKHRNMTEAGVRRKAKFIFYNEYKTNPALLDTLTNRLSAAGLLKYKKKGDVDVLDVPWSLIKQITDAEFDGMCEENKMTWYDKVVRPSP